MNSEQLIQEILAIPGMASTKKAKNVSTGEHFFYDSVKECRYITYKNGYIRRVVNPQAKFLRKVARGLTFMYPLNPRETYKKERCVHTGMIRYYRNVVLIPTEEERLQEVLRHIKLYRKNK